MTTSNVNSIYHWQANYTSRHDYGRVRPIVRNDQGE